MDQPQYPPGVGVLPLPCFKSESAGVAANGVIDHSFQLPIIERTEKKLRERDTKLKNPRIMVDTTASIDDQVGASGLYIPYTGSLGAGLLLSCIMAGIFKIGHIKNKHGL